MKNLKIPAPIQRWDEAIPLGNGRNGVLLWGDAKQIRLSLDRADLWDERTGDVYDDPHWNHRSIIEAARSGDYAHCRKLCDLSSSIPATKLPTGRIEIVPDGPVDNGYFGLDLTKAQGYLCNEDNALLLAAFCHALRDEIYLKINIPVKSIRIVPPDYQGEAKLVEAAGTVNSVGSLGYPPGKSGVSGNTRYYFQPCTENLCYAVFLTEYDAGEYVIKIVRRKTLKALETELKKAKTARHPAFENAFLEHRRWWREFWNRSRINLPDTDLQQHYELCRYFFGSSSRAGAPPMPLQGIWTADNGALPPWRGDFHHDLNTEFSYIAYLTSGDYDCGKSFLDYLTERIEIFRQYARDFFGCSGIAVPGVTSLAGQSLGGWPQYSFSPTCGAWLASMFTDHWRYTHDGEFLREQALPFVDGVAEFILQLLEKKDDGFYYLPYSTSPEIHDEKPEAFLTPNSNYDLSLLTRLFNDMILLNEAAGDFKAVKKWRRELKHLPPLSIDLYRGLMISPDEILHESHRHHSHLMAIYPLKLLNTDEHGVVIDNSLHLIDELGTGFWVGYSFGWMAAINAWCRMGDRALRLLKLYLNAFVSPNGFHLNGDFKNLGDSAFKYRPFTLEGNFAAMQAMHEMLLQSSGDIIRVFPALPAEWTRAAFENLRAEGNVRVSAELRRGVLFKLELEAETAQNIRLVAPGIPEQSIHLRPNEPWRWIREYKGVISFMSEMKEMVNN